MSFMDSPSGAAALTDMFQFLMPKELQSLKRCGASKPYHRCTPPVCTSSHASSGRQNFAVVNRNSLAYGRRNGVCWLYHAVARIPINNCHKNGENGWPFIHGFRTLPLLGGSAVHGRPANYWGGDAQAQCRTRATRLAL